MKGEIIKQEVYLKTESILPEDRDDMSPLFKKRLEDAGIDPENVVCYYEDDKGRIVVNYVREKDKERRDNG